MSMSLPIDSDRVEVISSTKWLSWRMRLSWGKPRNLDTGDHLLRKAVILGGPGRHRGKCKDALFVGWTLLQADALGDGRAEDFLAEDVSNLLVDVPRQDRSFVVKGDDNSEELEPGIRTCSDLFVGLEKVVGAFQGKVRRLNRNEEMRCRDQRVHGQDAERRRGVDHDVV